MLNFAAIPPAARLSIIMATLGLALVAGCHRAAPPPAAPPPDAQRPTIKSEAELAAQRDSAIASGAIVPSSAPVLLGEDRVRESIRTSPPPRTVVTAPPGAIRGDVFLVNETAVTAAQVLYPLREELAEARRTQTRPRFVERAGELIRGEVQRSIGSILVHAEAMSKLNEEQKKLVEGAVTKALEDRTAREFGGSSARLANHLAQHGLTVDQYKAALERDMIVRQYSREKFMPQVTIRRDELLGEFRRSAARFNTAETRELLLIEIPYAKLLPEGATWESATPSAKAQARLKATRRIREAHEALANRPFADVAREFSLGLYADKGGSWGMIGSPLQAPYDELSRGIFTLASGAHSEPIEMETGCAIVGCGAITPASSKTFAQVQEQLRDELMEKRFNRLAADYSVRLMESATISPIDPFVEACLARVEARSIE